MASRGFLSHTHLNIPNPDDQLRLPMEEGDHEQSGEGTTVKSDCENGESSLLHSGFRGIEVGRY